MQLTPPPRIASLSNLPSESFTAPKTMHADFTSYDVLSLRKNPRIKRVAHESIEQQSLAADRPRFFLSKSEDPFRKLEKEIAAYFSCEDALLFSSRNQALFSLFSLLLKESDCLYAADNVTGPLAEVCSLTGAELKQCNPYIENMYSSGSEQELVFLETVHPLNFESCYLPAPQQSLSPARSLILDESLALGILGSTGLGLSEEYRRSLKNSFLACIVDCSIILGQQGCFITSSETLIKSLRENSRVYRTEMPLAHQTSYTISETFLELSTLKNERTSVFKKTDVLANTLISLHFNVTHTGCYLSLSFDKYNEGKEIYNALLQRGIVTYFGSLQKPFSSQAAIRLIINQHTTEKEINYFLESLVEIGKR